MLSEKLSGREDTEYGKLQVTKLAFGMDNGITIACFSAHRLQMLDKILFTY